MMLPRVTTRICLVNSADYLGVATTDWNNIIDNLSNGKDITVDPTKWNLETSGYTEIYKLWKDSNFNTNAIKWTNFYPDLCFPSKVDKDLCEHLQVEYLRSWISRVDPGFYAPWHWDVDDNEKDYLEKGTPRRFSCFITPPTLGHIFMLGDDYFFNTPQGSLYEWKNYKEWHGGINAGFTPKFIYHLLAV